MLQLIGRGRSNSEIAAELFLSETTVKTHVTRIFTKLRLRDRAQAVVLAYETGLCHASSIAQRAPAPPARDQRRTPSAPPRPAGSLCVRQPAAARRRKAAARRKVSPTGWAASQA